MMGVIVDDRNAADRTFFFKTAFGSMESRQTTYNRSNRNLHLCAKSDRRKGILYIVLSRNGKCDLSDRCISLVSKKTCRSLFILRNIGSIEIIVSRQTIGNDFRGKPLCNSVMLFDGTI